jgi:DnaJ family protein A protein 2
VKGELRVVFDITGNDEIFQRKGMDLYYEKTITLKEALCGFSFDINHLNGKRFHINNAKNVIHPEYKKVIPNLGMVKGSQTGSLHVSFKIVFPERLEEGQVEALQRIL